MQELYEYIATLIDSIPEFKSVAVWNNQTNNEADELAPFLPAAYFSASVNWLSVSSGVRQGEATVSIYIATELYETQQNNVSSSTAYMSLVDDVFKKLGKAGFVSLSETPDTNHGNVPVHVSTYRYNFLDDTLKRTNTAAKKLQKTTPDLNIEK